MAYSINDIKNMTRKRGTTSASSSNSDRYSVDDIKGMTGAPRRDVFTDYAQMATQAPVQESKPSFRYNSYSEYENAINAVKPTGLDNVNYRAKGLWNSIADINRALPSLTPKWRDSVNQRKEYTDKEQEYADLTKEFELYKQDRGNVFREYNDRYKNNGDFAEKSQALPAAINAATMDTFMQNQAKTSGNADSSNRIAAYNNMSDDEKALANYLANTDLKAFWKYMSDMNAIEDKEIYEQGVQKKKAAIDKEPLIGAYYTAEGMANKIANAPAIPVEYALNAATGARQNPYSGAAGYANMGWDEQQLVSEKIREETGSDVLPFLYNTGVSIGESLLGAGTFGEGYSVLMGTSAFNNSYKELEERGASDAEIMTGALLAGAAETVFEKVSLENLLSPKDITSLPTLIRETLKQAGVEGSEELFTELSNIITDEISQGANSEINKMINEMRGNGVSEDEIKKTISDYIGRRIVESTLGGMLSGGAMGGVYNGANYAYNTEIGRNTNRAELAAAIEKMDRRSKTRRAYENAGRNLDNMKNAEVGAMAINALNEASSLDREAYGNALVDNLVAARLSKEDAIKIKDAYFKQKRSKTEEGYFDNSVVAEAIEKTWNEKGVELLNKANENAKRIARTVTNKTGVAKLLKKSDLKVGARTELNGEEVKVKDVIKDGDTIKVVTENGEVNPKDLTLSANDAAMVVAASGIDNEVKRQAYFANYDGVQNVAEYTESFDAAYRYGRLGMSEEQLTEDLGKSIHLTAEQAVNAFVKGQNEANTTSEKLDESLKSATKELEGFRKGKLTFDNVDVKSLNATQRGAVVLAEAFNNMGINVVLFNDSSDDSENGRYENGTVYINLSARYYKNAIKFDKGYVINTMAHELTHWMEDTAKTEFKALKKAIFDFYGEEETKKLIAKEQQRQKGLSDTAAESEVVARACEDMLSNADTLEKIMMGIDTNTRKSIIDKFKEFFEKLGRFLKNALLINSQSDAARMLRENAEVFEQVRQQWIKTFTEAVNNIQKNDVVAMAEDAILNDNQQEAIDLVGDVSETKLNSIKLDGDLAQASIEANKKYKNINPLVLNRALGLRKGVASSLEKLMMYLPEDIEGDIFSKNDSYGKSGEHSLICVRSLINRWFIERVANEVGRPLTAEEQIVASEILAGKVGNQRECQYCYVAADRRSYEADFGVYLKDVETAQERAVKEKATVQKELDFLTKNYDRLVEITKESDRDKYLKTDEAKNIKGLVTFLRGRSFTRPMIDRYMHIISDTLNGKERLQGKHLTSESTRARYASDPVIGWYVKDATKYAKSASKAKLTGREVKINGTTYYLEYVAYNGNILEMSQNVIDTLNEEYGLRMYSYSDYVPAFILEDMQVITDAAVRGLKMLAYTKDLGFVRVFAPSGININISTYGVLDTEYKNDKALNKARDAYKANPNDKTRKAYLDLLNKYVISDAMQGAEWEDVKALRNKYENVGSVFVATSDDLVEWALAQDWIDTVIPYHTVFRGLETKEYFGYTNYKDYESDKKLKGWTKGKDLESIPPTIHGNSLEKYEKALAENHLSKRFAQWADNPNYMKLVNETRLSYSESQPVQPEFNYDEGEVEKELARIPFEGKYGLGNGFNTLEEQQNAFADDFENAVKLIKAGKTSKADIEKFMAGETLFSTKVDSEGRELTEEQQKFFAESKIVDDNGNLLVMYHGTDSYDNFTVFKAGKNGYLGKGMYFTEKDYIAKKYAEQNGYDGRIYKVYLNVTNPLIVTSDNPALEILGEKVAARRAQKNSYSTRWLTPADIKKLQDKGYDGIVWKYGKSPIEVSVWDSNQVKLTTNENPTTNPDIRYSAKIDDGTYSEIKEHFGVTNNYNVAGYMLRDGTMLDFSGKHWGDTTSRTRQVDHRDIQEVLPSSNNGIDAMVRMISNGNIRLYPESGGINLAVPPTEEQANTLEKYINYHLSHGDKEITIDYDAIDGDTVDSAHYEQGASARQIIKDIESYFRGARQSDLMKFHSQFNDDIRYSLKADGYAEKDSKTLGLTDERIDTLLSGGWYGSTNPDYAQAYITYMSPDDFLKLTTGKNQRALERIKDWQNNEWNDTERPPFEMGKFADTYNNQPIQLRIDEEEHEVYGHEGRHRIWQLKQLGYDRVPVLLFNFDNKYDKKPLVAIDLMPQWFSEKDDSLNEFDKVIVKDLIPFSQGNRELIKEKFGTNSDADVKFSYKVDDETADIIGLNKALEEQNKKLKADVDRLNKRLKLEKTITKGKVMKDSDLETVAGMLLREVKSKADKAEVIEGLRDVYGYILDKSNEGIVYDEMMSKAYDVAKLIMNEAKPAAIIDDYFKDIMEDIRRARVKLTPEQIQEAKYTYGDKWRNALMGRITTVNEGRSLDSYWQEWAEMYPNVFDVNTNPNDQLVELSQIYDDLKDASVTMQRFNTHSDIMAMAEEVYDKFWNIRTETTTADKHDAEIKKLKFEHRKAMAEVKEQQSLLDDMYYGRKIAEYKHRDVKKDAEIVRLKNQYGKMIEKIRERSAKREADLKQFMKDRDARLKNNAERRKLISKITEVSEDLSKRLLKGEKGKKVPQALKAPLAELLTAIDFSSKQLLGINTIKKAGIETKRDIAMSALLNRVSLALQGFNDAKAEGDDAYDLAGLHLPPNYATDLQEIADTIATVEQTAEGSYVLQYMTAEQLDNLYKAIKAIRTAINNVNKIISTNNAHEVDYIGNEIMTDLDKLGQRKIDNAVTQFMSVANKTPYYFFKHMGKGGQEVFSFLQNGWDKLADNVEVIKNFTRGKKKDGSDALYTSQEFEKWKNTVHEFDVLEAPTPDERAEGKEGRQRHITMTEAQIMALYCLSKREQAMLHISRDGIVIDEIKTKKKYGKHEIKKQDTVTLAPTDLEKILSVVTSDARMKQVSDKIQEFMSTVCAEWGNEVTMKLYGTEEFTEKNYFPIHVNQEVLSSEAKNKSHSIYGMLNQSFTKPLNDKARNEINIADIFDVFNAHASDMAKYNALALPIMDVIKVWNYKENLDRGDNGQREVKAVKKSITKAIGKAGNSYISGLLRDLNGDAESGRYDKTSMRLVKNYKTAAVAANVQTALLQPLAYIRAGYMVNPKYLRKALTRKPKINECIRDLGVQKWKSMGFYDTNLTRGLDKIISNSDNLIDTIVDKSLWLTEKMDEVTWGYLYTAIELETKDKYPSLSGEKLKEQTIKRLRDVVYGTQVFDSTLARTAMMRSTSALVQMETSFGAEPILSVNMLMDAATEFNQEARRTDFATAVSKKGKLLARASAVYLVASVVESALRAALKKIRDYDDEDDTFEGLTSDILERTLEELDVLNKIPWVKEAMPYIRKFVYKKLGFEEMSKSIYADNSRMDTEVFATIDSAIKSIDKALEGENLTYKDVQKISQALSQTSGLPISNVIKEFKVVWNNTVGRITGNTIK